ncbi:Modulator of FtsH protease HflK [Buchnera aphidicola (Eriosoma lanigerum)]|uniref:SPFH domain-containing protein n=1 Tax=Buchnera aphidicola TaxID=9 RepID=UPI0034639412
MPWNQPNNNQPNFNPWKDKKNNKNIVKIKCFIIYCTKKMLNILIMIKKKMYNCCNIQLNNRIKYAILFFLLSFFFIWIISSWYIIKFNERGVVTNFGKFSCILSPGVYWKPRFITKIKIVDIHSIKKIFSSGIIFTTEKNVIFTKMKLEYIVIDPVSYSFSSVQPSHILHQILNSELYSLSDYISMHDIFFHNLKLINNHIKNKIQKSISNYQLGIKILNVYFTKISVPKLITSNWNELNLAKAYKKKCIRDAENYSKRVLNVAHEHERKMFREIEFYKIRKFLEIRK